MAGSAPVVVAEGLRKTYGTATTALDGFGVAVPEGTVHGLLGPNGAGKTTAVRVLATLLRADAGSAQIAGLDVRRQAASVRRRIGLVGQQTALDDLLTGRENLVMFARLFHLRPAAARARADELLAGFGLAEAAERPVRTYSGGMRRRLDLAAGMVPRPAVLFLDEPTTGLDPRGRSEVWDAVRALVRAGTAVLLTTQYLDEADQLADTVSVIDAGRVIASGPPAELKSGLGDDRLVVAVRDGTSLAVAARLVERVTGTAADVDEDTRRISAPVRDRVGALVGVVQALTDAGIAAVDIGVRQPTLDEVFLHLTGHHAEQVTA